MKNRLLLITVGLLACGNAFAASTNTTLPFVRFTRQLVTGPSAVIATESMAAGNAEDIQSAGWVQSTEAVGTIPPLNFYTNTPLTSYDAYKYVSDYTLGTQKAYAGMVAYRFTTPMNATGQASDLTSVTAGVYCDRWLIGGVRVAVYTTDTSQPSATWATLRDGDAYSSAILPAVDPRADQNTNVTISLPGSTTVDDYIWVVVSLEDYESVSPLDVRRLEGGAMLVGQSISAVFSVATVLDDEKKKYVAGWNDASGQDSYDATWSSGGYFSLMAGQFQGVLGKIAGGTDAYTVADGSSTIESGLENGGAGYSRIHAGYIYRWGNVGTEKQLTTMSIAGAVPASHANTQNRLVVYWTEGSFDDALSAGTIADHEFWNGTATSITTTSGTFSVESLVSSLIIDAIPAATSWPIRMGPDNSFQLIMAMSVEWIDAAPAANTSWDAVFTPGLVTFTE